MHATSAAGRVQKSLNTDNERIARDLKRQIEYQLSFLLGEIRDFPYILACKHKVKKKEML